MIDKKEKRIEPYENKAHITSRVESAALEPLRRLSLPRWLAGAAADWAAIAFAVAVAGWTRRPVVYVAAVFVIGIHQNALAIMGHDGAHRLACAQLRLNDFLANLLCFWPLGTSLEGYRRFHFQHHKYLNTPDDPELQFKRDNAPEWDLPFAASRLAKDVVKDLLGLNILKTFQIVSTLRPVTPAGYVGLVVTTLVPVFFIVHGHRWFILALWYAATFTVFPAIFRLRVWTEHVGTAGTNRLAVPGWLRWMITPHNTWFHWEHHAYPTIPHWNLSKIRRLDRSKPVEELSTLVQTWTRTPVIKSGTPLTIR